MYVMFISTMCPSRLRRSLADPSAESKIHTLKALSAPALTITGRK